MSRKHGLETVVLSGLVLAGVLYARSAEPPQSSGTTQATAATHPSPSQTQSAAPVQGATSRSNAAAASHASPVWRGAQANRLSQRAEMYFEGVWGVDELRVKVAESGELIRFNYRVVDAQKATALNDKKAEPELLDPQAGIKLSVPQMEKVGKLRQSSTPKAGMTYWMAFSNPTMAVKRGHRVDVVIGSFHATNLLVE